MTTLSDREGPLTGQALFLVALARLEQWLAREQIPYAVFGSVAACAWTDQDVLLDFDRPGARDPAERLPDIDVLVPRASIGAVRSYASAVRRSALPVIIDTFWAECWIDFRPGAERSYLTHRAVRLAVPTELFTPRATSFLGQDVAVLDPRTLLHIYGTVGVVRRKDEPRISGLADALASRAIDSRFSDRDFQAFASFMLARHHRYRLFFVAKHAWVILLDALPSSISQALNHHVQLRVNRVFRLMNRRRNGDGWRRWVKVTPGTAWRAARGGQRRIPGRRASAPCQRTALPRLPP